MSKASVLNQDSHAVAKIEHLGSRRIVAGTNGIHTHIFHDLKLTFQSAGVDGWAEASQIVMQTNATNFRRLPVQIESGGNIETESTEAKQRFVTIHQFAIGAKFGDRLVTSGILRTQSSGFLTSIFSVTIVESFIASVFSILPGK